MYDFHVIQGSAYYFPPQSQQQFCKSYLHFYCLVQLSLQQSVIIYVLMLDILKYMASYERGLGRKRKRGKMLTSEVIIKLFSFIFF